MSVGLYRRLEALVRGDDAPARARQPRSMSSRILDQDPGGRGRCAACHRQPAAWSSISPWYRINMRKAISITLSADNLLWLKGQVTQSGRGSVSELLDRLITEARGAGWADASAVRSVVGTVDLPDDDPGLETADAYLRTLFAASARQPLIVRERPAATRTAKRTRRG